MDMTSQPRHARTRQIRSKPVKPGRLPVSEFAFDRPGAGSPFGDDIEFPVPVERLTYEHPEEK
jgi:succinate dehydrogenase / fumarate reductase iron-sulfur subunit